MVLQILLVMLLVVMHHIVSDGWSFGVLARELGALYEAFAAGEVSPLPVLPVQYADYAVWQRAWLQGEVRAQQLTYWQEQLSGLSPLELPLDLQLTVASRTFLCGGAGTCARLILSHQTVPCGQNLR